MQKRPKHLNLLAIRLPLPGVVSILHRVSGVVLVLALPLALLALHCATASNEGFESVAAALAHPFVKLCLWAAAWALAHHMFAGARFLLLDLHIGVGLPQARASAAAALAAGLLCALLFGVWLWT